MQIFEGLFPQKCVFLADLGILIQIHRLCAQKITNRGNYFFHLLHKIAISFNKFSRIYDLFKNQNRVQRFNNILNCANFFGI